MIICFVLFISFWLDHSSNIGQFTVLIFAVVYLLSLMLGVDNLFFMLPRDLLAEPKFLTYMLILGIFFCTGSVIGWIYGKIKSRK